MNASGLGASGVAVIVGFFSTFVFNILITKPNQLELSITVILVYFLWFATVNKIKNSKVKIQFLEHNKDLKDVILKFIYFISTLTLFLAIQVLLNFFRNSFGASEPTLFEVIGGIYVILALGYLIIQIFGNIK